MPPVIIGFPTNIQVISKAGLTFPATTPSSSVTVTNLMYSSYSCNGVFLATSSTNFSIARVPGNALNGSTSVMWASATNMYNGSGVYVGAVNTTDTFGTNYSGEWLQLKVPFSFILTYWSCAGHSTKPTIAYCTNAYIMGSSDGTNWNLLATVTATTYSTINTGTTLSSNINSYSYYRFIVNKFIGDVLGCISNVVMKS